MKTLFASRQDTGFTLVETLVAVVLVTFAVGGPFLAASNAYTAALDAENRLTATFLAQEGLEYVRMLRDNTYLADYQAGVGDLSNTAFFNHFLNGENGGQSVPNSSTSVFGCETNTATYPFGGDGNKACALDVLLPVGIGTGKALQACTALDCSDKPLLLSSGQYNLSSGATTPFKRSIRFYSLRAEEVDVEVMVVWDYHGSPRQVILTSYLSPWL